VRRRAEAHVEVATHDYGAAVLAALLGTPLLQLGEEEVRVLGPPCVARYYIGW
jgi:hypothetical protein